VHVVPLTHVVGPAQFTPPLSVISTCSPSFIKDHSPLLPLLRHSSITRLRRRRRRGAGTQRSTARRCSASTARHRRATGRAGACLPALDVRQVLDVGIAVKAIEEGQGVVHTAVDELAGPCHEPRPVGLVLLDYVWVRDGAVLGEGD
jgi:hypothetical protein